MISSARPNYLRAAQGMGQIAVQPGQTVLQPQPQSSPPPFGGQWVDSAGHVRIAPPLQMQTGGNPEAAFNTWVSTMQAGIRSYQDLMTADPSNPGYAVQLDSYRQVLANALANRTLILASLPGGSGWNPNAWNPVAVDPPAVVNPTPPSQSTGTGTPPTSPGSTVDQSNGGTGAPPTIGAPSYIILPPTATYDWAPVTSTNPPITLQTLLEPGSSSSSTGASSTIIPGVPNWLLLAGGALALLVAGGAMGKGK